MFGFGTTKGMWKGGGSNIGGDFFYIGSIGNLSEEAQAIFGTSGFLTESEVDEVVLRLMDAADSG